MIQNIKLENFKRVSLFETELDKINVLVGTNNSGKSSVLQGIHFTILIEVARKLYGRNKTVAQNDMLYVPTTDSSLLRHGDPYSVSSGNVSTLSLTSETGDTCDITLRKGRGFGNIVVEAIGNNAFRAIVNNSEDLFVSYTPGISGIASSEQLVGKAVLRNAAARGDANLYLHNIIYYIQEARCLDQLNNYIHTVFPDSTISVEFDPNKDTSIKVSVMNAAGASLPLNLCGTGFLQIIQIMAYAVFFKPKLMLLDEPDEHLHPENQYLLCEAIKSISEVMDMQVILATHSRNILSALKDDAKFIWMQNGRISENPISPNMYEVLVDLGALDSYDAILQGRFDYVILTEDSDKKYLKKLLEFNGYDLTKVNIIAYNSCSHLDAAIALAEYLFSQAPRCKYLIHRDRDFMTDNEITYVSNKFKNPNIKLWVTDECDIEAYYTTAEHIAEMTGKILEEVNTWINSLLQTYHVDIQNSFMEKRNEIKRQCYFDNYLKGEVRIDQNKCPDTITLFGRAIPTSRKNAIGKFLLKKCNGDIINFAGRHINLIANSAAIQVQSLKDALA